MESFVIDHQMPHKAVSYQHLTDSKGAAPIHVCGVLGVVLILLQVLLQVPLGPLLVQKLFLESFPVA